MLLQTYTVLSKLLCGKKRTCHTVVTPRVAPSKKADLLRDLLEKDARKKKKTIVFSNKEGMAHIWRKSSRRV